MIKHNIHKKHQSSIQTNNSTEGETIEQKVARIVSNKEPITDGAPIIYMDRKDGINPDTDVRSDRFEVALEATDKITKTKLAKREERQKKSDNSQKGTEPIQGTEPPQPAA